jgi:acyl dehydratase
MTDFVLEMEGDVTMTDTLGGSGPRPVGKDFAERAVDPWQRTIRGRPPLGAVATRSRRTTSADIVAFAEITGDRNPLHFDAELASRSVFGRLIVQGGVTSGLLNALVAEDLPGPGTVFLGVEWSFRKAVGVGERITARAEVLSVRDDKPICELATTILDEAGDVVLTGRATTYTVALG